MAVSAATFKSRQLVTSYPNVRTLTVEAEVIIDDPATEGPLAVEVASGLPVVGDSYNILGETDANLFCIRKSPVQDATNDLVWRVTLEYSNQVGLEAGGGDVIVNPLDRPVNFSYSGQSGTLLVTTDIFGNPLVTVLGEPLGTQEIEEGRAVLRFVRNEPQINTAAVQIYSNAVNLDDFAGFAPTTLKMRPISVEGPLFENDVTYFTHGYEMEFNPRGWRRPLLNAGRTGIDTVDDARKTIKDNHLISPPVSVEGDRYPLDSAGLPLDPTQWDAEHFVYLAGGGQVVVPPSSSGPPFDGAQFYREASFSALGLI